MGKKDEQDPRDGYRKHSTRDAAKGKKGEKRRKVREALAMQDKANASRPQYRPNGPN